MKPFYYLILSSSILLAEPRTLQTLVVDSDSAESLTQPTLEQDKLDLAKIPGGTEVIDAERFLTGRSSTLADTFFLSPGVVAQSRFGSDEARISIRGSGLQRTFHGRGIKFLQDGVPLNQADGGFDFQAVDPLAISHINVWRGGNALSQGSTTLGGAIDYISQTGRSAPGYSLRAEAGSYEYFRTRFSGALTEGSQDLYFSLSQTQQNGFRDHAVQEAQRFFSNYGIQLTDDLETRFFIAAIHTDSDLPGSLTKAQLDANPRQAGAGVVAQDNRRDFELFRISNKTTLRRGDNTFDFFAAWTYRDLDHPLNFGVIDQQTNDFLIGTTFENNSELYGRENRLRSGLNFTYGDTDNAIFANNGGIRGFQFVDTERTATNLEYFIENQHEISPGLTITAALAAAYSTREESGTATLDEDYFNIAPALGATYEVNGIQYFGGYSRSFEPPSFSETSFVAAGTRIATDAQTADTVEIGSRATSGPIRWDVTAYYSRINDELLALTDAATGISATINADRTVHYGLETGFEADLLGSDLDGETPAHRLVLRSSYTYGSFRFDGDDQFGDNRIAGIPPHLLRGELLWENDQGYYAGPTFEWVPVESFIDHSNTLSADPYALVGFKVGRRVSEGVSWFIEAKNLTDERFAATHGVIQNANGTDTAQFLPGDGRSVFAGFEWKF